MQFESQGYIQISGSSEYFLYDNNIIIESNSYIQISSYYSYYASSFFDSIVVLSLSSNPIINICFSYIGSGSIGSFGFSSNFIKPYNARGGIKISSTYGRNYNAKFNFDFDSRFVAYGTGDPDFALSLSSKWTINSGNYYWYRILACSRHSSSEENEEINYTNNLFDEKFQDPKCGYGRVSMLTAVAARSIGEVCSILKDPKLGPPLKFKIISIKKYTDPITGNGIRTLLQDEEFCNSSECQDFCLDFDFTQEKIVNINVNMTVVRNIFYHESNGNITISGSAQILYLNEIGSGLISLSGQANIVSPFYFYNSVFELSLENKLDVFVMPLLRSFTGSLTLTGSVLDFISPKYNYQFLLELGLQSNTEILMIIPFDSYAIVQVEGQADIDTDQNFVYESSGFIIIDSSVDNIESSYFEYKSDGEALSLMGGSNELLSSSWRHDASGFVEVSGYNSKIGRCQTSLVYLVFSGSAVVNKTSSFNSTGLLELSGLSEVISPNRNFTPTGLEFSLDGTADLNFTNLGLLVAHASMNFSYLNLVLDSQLTQNNQNNLSINTGIVDACGCITALNADLLHNLRYTGEFSKFLKRNPLVTFDTNLSLRYKASRNSWYNSTSVKGLSADNQQVVWQFITELSCTNVIENQNFDDYYLKFNLLVKYKKLDQVLSTNLLVNINAKQICRDNQQLSMTITYNTFENAIYVDNVKNDFYKLIDDIGLFSNNYWGGKKDFSTSRPKYCTSSNPQTLSPPVVGSFPEFIINVNNPIDNINQSILDGCSVAIEKLAPDNV